MPRYYFHVRSPKNPVRDTHGVELAGLDAAHWRAMHLVYRLREHEGETGEDWVIEVSDEAGAVPLVVLPSAVPMLRESSKPSQLGGAPLKSPLAGERLPLRAVVGAGKFQHRKILRRDPDATASNRQHDPGAEEDGNTGGQGSSRGLRGP